jgi:DNA-binding SARP family transcriptional activator
MSGLELKFLGEFAVIRDGRPLPLPPSKKTRALLAYLALTGRRFRREHLCELLWEIPDDPRGSLRWSLSKLRHLVDDEGRQRVVADRATVGVDTSDVTIDVAALHAAAAGLGRASTGELADAAARWTGNFLEGLEFSSFHDFHAWCIAERERSARAQSSILRELVQRLSGDDAEAALPYARALVGIAPYEEASRAALIRLLVAAHHVEEAEQQFQLGLRMLKEAGIVSTGGLLQARRGTAGDAPRPAPAPRVAAAPVPRSVAASPVLVGRDEESRELAGVLDRVARAMQAEIVLVRGEAGIGKSRLLEHVARLAANAGAFVLRASAFEPESLRPFALWIDALRATRPAAVEQLFGGSAIENRDRLFSGLSGIVEQESRTGPVVLVFDDVQWCDDSSAAALHYVARTNAQRRLLVVLAARETELQDNVPLQQALRGWRHEGVLSELKLGPLTEEAIAAIIEARAPGADSGRLSRECGGNPLIAIELARAENDGGSGGSLTHLIRERLARFDVDRADVLRWAALLSPRIDLAMLAKLSGLDAAEVGATLEEAERQTILTTTDRGWAFPHELIARAVYTEISPVRRRVMHRRVAELMEQDAALDLAWSADLAHHATQSGDAALAARAMVSAGKLCLRFFANDEALALARRGLQLAERLPPAERVRVSIELHDIVLASSPLEDWDAEARRYVELAEHALDHGALAHARLGYHMAAYVRWQHGQWAGAREQSLQSERVVRGANDADHIIGMAQTARCLTMLERDLARADAMLMEAHSLAERSGFTDCAIPSGIGMLRLYENRLEEAEELFKEARALAKSAGDRLSEFQANEYLVMIELQRGLYERARERCDELVAIGSRLREGSEAPFARALHGLCVYALEDDATALDAAVSDLRIADAKHRLAFILTRAALVDIERKRIDSAVTRGVEALACATLLERATEMMLAHLVLAHGAAAKGDNVRAKAHEDAVAALEASGVAAWARDTAAALTRPKRRRRA